MYYIQIRDNLKFKFSQKQKSALPTALPEAGNLRIEMLA